MRKHVIGLFVIAACGGSGGAIPIGDLATTEINDICDLYVRCGVFPDAQTCRDEFGLVFSNEADLIAAVNAGKVIYDGNKARECLDGFIGNSCDRRDLFGNRNPPIACDETFVGTLGDGAACAISQECISQDCVLPTCPVGMCCAGACMGATAPVRAHVGETCSSTAKCLDSYCNGQTMKCEAYLADGVACTSSTSCDSNVCVTTCQPLVASGGACTNTQACQNIGESCLSTTMTCGKGANVGATCNSISDCEATLYCDATKVCAARPKVGESCAVVGSCLDTSYCDATTKICTARKADGSPCQSQSECSSDKCDTSGTHQCYTPPVCI
jgi:hypothetical protein